MPYPPVFHDWRVHDRRVATGQSATGVEVQMMCEAEPGLWRTAELTEDDACLLAASLLTRAERVDLAERVLDGLEPA